MDETIHGFVRGETVRPKFPEYGFGTVLALSEARMKRATRPDAVTETKPQFVWIEHDDGSITGWYPESLRRA